MIQIGLDPISTRKLKNKLRKMSVEAQEKAMKHTNKTAYKIDNDTKMNINSMQGISNWSAVSGAQHVKLATKSRLIAQVSNNHKAAIFLHEGTKPHVIKAKNSKYLKFQVAVSGSLITRKTTKEWVNVEEVHHPGTPKNPFMRKAVKSNYNYYINGFKNIV